MTHFEKDLLAELRGIRAELHRIACCVCQEPLAGSATLSFITSKGETNMPLTVHVNDVPGTALFQEWSGPSGTGIVVPPVGTVTYASDNTAVATVDPNSGQLAYVSAGTANISGTDAGNGLTASDVLTVSAATAVSATLTLTPGA
jgi:hypothetical protein